METRLQSLTKRNNPENRKKDALEAKRAGKKVIGLLCTCIPEEVIYAAGMFPWHITGTWDGSTAGASVYFDPDACQYCTHALEALLRGELEFLDGIVASDWDDNRRRLFDVWRHVSKPSFAMIMTAPRRRTASCETRLAKESRELASALEGFGETTITDESLWQSITIHNETRILMHRILQLQRRQVPALRGAEMLGLATAGGVMERARFNAELREIMPYMERRQLDIGSKLPRILVISELIDNPLFIELIEREGCQVVADDVDKCSRYFDTLVDENAENPFLALARRYCWRRADSTAFNWEDQIASVVAEVRQFRVDGVIEIFEEFSPAARWRAPLLSRELARFNIPYLKASRGYNVDHVGQLRTRVAAFLETIQVPGVDVIRRK